MPVKIVTDSVTDIPARVVAKLGITVIPILVRFGEETYRDGIDITTDQFFQKLINSKVMPTTSVPSMDLFARTYARLAEETDEILAIMLSSRLSGIYNAAVQSAELVESDCRIEVMDSGCAVMAQGFVVIRAAQAALEGASLDEIMELVKRDLPRVEIRAAFDTLEFLHRGGRIGKAAALMGSMLKINPIVALKDGVVEPAGRARSRAKAIDHLVDFAESYSNIEELAVEGGDCPEDVDNLVERLGNIFPKERIYHSRATPVIGAHTGPGLILVAVLGDK
ncbi:MAG: DegV family protein [Dehalococcoidales bacterium]|nr:DegV family protein [Dehalococcoidales bacterium]